MSPAAAQGRGRAPATDARTPRATAQRLLLGEGEENPRKSSILALPPRWALGRATAAHDRHPAAYGRITSFAPENLIPRIGAEDTLWRGRAWSSKLEPSLRTGIASSASSAAAAWARCSPRRTSAPAARWRSSSCAPSRRPSRPRPSGSGARRAPPGSINSDHVTEILDVEEDPEHGIVLVFELLEGESLIDRLKRTGPIDFEELHPIIEQVWMGLADAHRAGIIHRDLKPSNVYIEARPDGSKRVKILDFGISKLPKEMGAETLTEMGQSLGTFSFMPPEQIGKARTVDHRADIYACATMIYQSMSGQLPYQARQLCSSWSR